MFVHQSHITPKQSTYRTLEDNGMRVGLSLDDKNTTQAVNVVFGTLLCDAHVERQKYLSRKEQEEANMRQLSNLRF